MYKCFSLFHVLCKEMFTCLDGPEEPFISGPTMVKVGDNVTLSCYAPSNPRSSYKWLFNESVVADTATYVTPPFTMKMQRVYTCVAYNSVTDKNSTANKMIYAIGEGFFVVVLCGGSVVVGFTCVSFKCSSLESVVFSDPITHAQVELLMKTAIRGQPYNLTCNMTGPADHIHWFKNGQPLQADNQTIVCANHTTIIFNPLHKNHTGLYHCNATNVVSTIASRPYLLLVNCE